MKIHKRKVQNQINKALDAPEVFVIFGSRQTGKTILLNMLDQDCRQQWGDKKDVLFFDLQNPDHLDALNRDPRYFAEYCQFNGADPEKELVVLIDDIHNLRNPVRFLSGVKKLEPSIKLIVSSAADFTEEKVPFKPPKHFRYFTLFPVDFEEFLRFKGKKSLCDARSELSYLNFVDNHSHIEKSSDDSLHQEMNLLFDEFILYGGYPKVVVSRSKKEKMNCLRELLESFELRSVNVLFNVANMSAFRSFLKLLAGDTGALLNVNALSRNLRIGRDTVRRYLAILEQSFMVTAVMPFHSNQTKELTKMPKIFFGDTGVRNFVINNFSELRFRPDKKQLYENTICCELMKNLHPKDQLFYWRTIARNEVDFVLTGKHNLAFDVKAEPNAHLAKRSGFNAFSKLYSNFQRFVVNFEEFSSHGDVTCVPGWMV